MPTPSKFTAERRQRIIQALSIGASRNTAAGIAGVDESAIRRWIAKGKEAEPGSRFREFYEEVIQAEASPRMRALGIIYKEMPDNPVLAWKYIERREPGFAPPVAGIGAPSQQPVVIQLNFHDGSSTQPALTEGDVVEGEVVDEHYDDEEPEPRAGADPPESD